MKDVSKEDLPKPILLEDLGLMYATENSKQKIRFGIYKCGFCGTEFKSNTGNIKNKHTKSCGCHKKRRIKEANTKHGLGYSRLYNIWSLLKDRVLNPKHKNYKDYGGRGITICDEWLDVQNFYNWAMSNGYSDELSIDRIDNAGNYEPSNCRWTTKTIQSRNTRIQKNNTSGYRGVSYIKKTDRYRAKIYVNKNEVYLGCFQTAVEGAVAYNNYIISNNLEGFILNEIPNSHIPLQLPTKPHHQTLE